jgi:PKD repeat protein
LTDVAPNCTVNGGPSQSAAVTTGGKAEVGFTVGCAQVESNRLEIISGNDQSGAAGTVLPQALVVQVLNPSNNPVAGVTIQWSAEGGGSVGAAITLTDATGRASTNRTLGPNVGQQTTQASAAGLTGSPVIFTHTATTAGGGVPTQIVLVTGNDQEAEAGAPLANPLVVKVTDEAGNPVAGVPVQWTVQGGGSVSEELTETEDNGQASVTRTLGPAAGPQGAEASVVGLSGSPVRFNHTARAVKTASATTITSDSPDPSVPGEEVTVRFTVTGDGSVPTGNLTVTVSGGSATERCSGTVEQGSCVLSLEGLGDRTLTATYEGDAAFTASSDREVHRVNSPPAANFDVPECVANQPCAFKDASTDNDGTIKSWSWDFDDRDQPYTDASPEHTFVESGDHTVRLTITDDDGASNSVEKTVSVGPGNTAPTANDDSYQTGIGASLYAPDGVQLGLLDNDEDPESDDMVAVAETKATREGGSVTINEDGSFEYTPPSNFTGSDSFEYTVSDSKGATSTAHANIEVTA